MSDAPCQFVIERATEGLCETCGHDRSETDEHDGHFIGLGDTPICDACFANWQEKHHESEYEAEPNKYWHHPYLGPVLKRCGHEEKSHEPNFQGDDSCFECYGDAYTDEDERHFHAYEPPPDAAQRPQEQAERA